jgi:NTP pyrophosphatase (non-canonical NTP hydrolase)
MQYDHHSDNEVPNLRTGELQNQAEETLPTQEDVNDAYIEVGFLTHGDILALNGCAAMVREQNKNWWVNITTGEPLERNVGELLALVHSEVSEALEGHRKNLMDDHLPHRKMFEVELADVMIRVFDIAGGLGLDIGGAVAEKLSYNKRRADHKIENRLGENGKKY